MYRLRAVIIPTSPFFSFHKNKLKKKKKKKKPKSSHTRFVKSNHMYSRERFFKCNFGPVRFIFCHFDKVCMSPLVLLRALASGVLENYATLTHQKITLPILYF